MGFAAAHVAHALRRGQQAFLGLRVDAVVDLVPLLGTSRRRGSAYWGLGGRSVAVFCAQKALQNAQNALHFWFG